MLKATLIPAVIVSLAVVSLQEMLCEYVLACIFLTSCEGESHDSFGQTKHSPKVLQVLVTWMIYLFDV